MTFRLLLPLLLTLPASGQQETSDPAAFSRDTLLPLVSNAGKDKALFSSITPNESCSWNPDCWVAPLGFGQFTGVAWNSDRAGVLVTPQHVLTARHFPLKPGMTVTFYDQNGRCLAIRKIAPSAEGAPSIANLANDVMVAKLDKPVPSGARIYPLPDPKTHELRLSWSRLPKPELPLLIATDWKNQAPPNADGSPPKKKWIVTRSVHPVRLAPSNGNLLTWSYGPAGEPRVHKDYHEVINFGDSSHPLFWISKSGLVLASTFTSTNSGPNYGSPEVQTAIQNAITKLGGKEQYSLKTISIP